MLNLLSYLVLSAICFAKPPVFTTIFYDGEGVVYTALKQEQDKMRTSQVVSFPYPNGEVTRWTLPEDVAKRDIVGILPDKDKLFLLSSDSSVVDAPTYLHLWTKAKNTWKEVGKVDCKSFARVRLSMHQFTFSCDDQIRKGRTKFHKKVISLGKERLFRSGDIRFPEFLFRYKGATFLLEGLAPEWDRLRIKSETTERLITANELFQSPAALGAPAAPDASKKDEKK